MGSLPPSHLDFSSANHGNEHHHHQEISKDNLLALFKSQQDLLNHFFKHLDLPQTLDFSRILLSTSGTVFFTGVGKSAFVANKISQTLISLSFRSSFLSPLDALHGDIGALSSRDVLVLFSKSGSTEELLRKCAEVVVEVLPSVGRLKPRLRGSLARDQGDSDKQKSRL
ncbi:hypothetical protein DY000_02061354 [Brassica cretica]|uniref:SIS domain-containing protein n=1 Tax=Brassica cretica TaxID=69181 RepID=A0ABQ7AYM0_BRACR|nr:hypothetical protein DY000_02061354 [Brassica cretica]